MSFGHACQESIPAKRARVEKQIGKERQESSSSTHGTSVAWKCPAGAEAAQALLVEIASDSRAPLQTAEREQLHAAHEILKTLQTRCSQNRNIATLLIPAPKWARARRPQPPPEAPSACLLNQMKLPKPSQISSEGGSATDDLLADQEQVSESVAGGDAPVADAWITEEDWQRRQGKNRMHVVQSFKATPEYEVMARLRAEGKLGLSAPRTPDGTDRSLSKRMWEQEVMHWRKTVVGLAHAPTPSTDSRGISPTVEEADDEATIRKKQNIIARVIELLQDSGSSMPVGHIANDSVIQSNRIRASRWLANTIRENSETLSISEDGHWVNLAGLEATPPPRDPSIFVSPPHCIPWDDGSPLLVTPGHIQGKKLLSLYQNKMKAALDEGDLPLAETLVCEARHRNNVAVNAQMLNWLVHARARGKDPDAAADWLERMQPEFGVKPTARTFAHVLDGYADSASSFAEADDLLSKMENYGLCPDIRCLNAMIKVWCKSPEADPDMDIAEAWFDRAAQSLGADSFSFGHMIYGCVLRRDVKGAKRWFSDMLAQSLPPTVEICTWMFDVVATASIEDQAFAISVAKLIGEEMKKVDLHVDRRCWQSLVRAVGKHSANEILS